MFYHTLVLGRKGPLAKVWLAATYRKKLSKKDIINVNVAESVEAILCSRVLMSLRLSSHLLYGISYLFNQQVSYLLSDALQYAYHVPQFIEEQGIDLLDQSTRDINLSDDNLDYELLPESCGASEFKIINATKTRILGDLAEVISEEFESLDVLRNDNLLNESIHTDEILFEDRVFTDDGFGGNLDQDPTTVFDIHAPSTSKAAKKRSGRSQEPVQDERQENIEEHHPTVDDNITENIENLGAGPDIVVDFFDLPTQPTPAPDVQEDHPEQPSDEALNVDNLEPVAGPSMEQARRPSTSRYSRLELNDEELVLEPLDESHKRAKRKKANIVLIDEVTSIPRARMMGNFRDASETSGRERAPSTKFLMMTKASGTDTVLLNNPSTKYVSSIALALFKSCLKMESDSNDDDDDLLPTQDANPTDAAPDQEIPNEELPSVLFEEEINDLPPPDIPEEPIPEVPVVEQEKVTESEPTARVGLKEPVPESQSSQPSQERGSQRRRKRRRLSQEQARRGTIYEPEILPRESIIEFEKTHMDVDPPEEEVPLFSQSQSEFSSTPEEGILSQLSQSLSEPVSFSQLTQDCNRKKAALTFFQLLALHKRCVIILAQEQYYEEIYISKGPNFRGTLDVY